MMDRHTKMNAKVLLIWVLILAAIWLLWGCKCGKNIGRSEARTDSTAQSEQTTIIEVFANNTDAVNKPTANNERGENEGRKAERGKRRRFAAQRPVEPTLADQECAGVVADLIENGGGVVKITRTKKATSTTDRQQQQLDRVIKQRNDWVFFLGVVVAVAVGTRLLRK
ncbi:MAG: hypothetical protein J5651_03305 [Salinivirgaceae bacterium]|nr:hypothetical protein [Salinivirgaceae bacterium]